MKLLLGTLCEFAWLKINNKQTSSLLILTKNQIDRHIYICVHESNQKWYNQRNSIFVFNVTHIHMINIWIIITIHVKNDWRKDPSIFTFLHFPNISISQVNYFTICSKIFSVSILKVTWYHEKETLCRSWCWKILSKVLTNRLMAHAEYTN